MLEISPAGRDDKPTHAGIGENDISGDGETYRYCWGSCLTPTYALLSATDVRPAGVRLVSPMGVRARWGPLALSRAARCGTG